MEGEVAAGPDAPRAAPAGGAGLRLAMGRCLASAGLAIAAFLIALAGSGPRGLALPSFEKRWSIGVFAGPTPLALASDAAVPNPVLTARDVRDVPAWFVADPFLVREGPRWHLFFEVFNRTTHQGDIGWATSADGRRWDYRCIVLDERFHLSYPCVFSDGPRFYMTPESFEAGAVRLYRAGGFPKAWDFVCELVRGPGLVDPTVVRVGDRWWLFVGTMDNRSLLAYHASRPEGPWTAHAANPIVRDSPDHARPGGRIVHWNGRLIRFAQDDSKTYGRRATAHEITTLTPTAYAERQSAPAFAVGPSWPGWNSAGMHHVDPVAVAPDRWVAAVDGCELALMIGYRRLKAPWRPDSP